MRINKTVSIIISFLIIWTILPLQANAANKKGAYETKDEVIYGKLYGNGLINEMYVVNSFYGTTEGKITDYGTYGDVRNLTDLSTIEKTDELVTFQSTGEDFYYQGELSDLEMPWHINISYYLDGVKIDADDLAGQSGKLEIHIETTANKKVDSVFFDYYLLQISLTLDPLHFQQITAPKGTEANEGKNKLINFSAMPGEEDIFITTATVENLTMDPISISAIPANLAFDDPDISDMEKDMQKLSDAIGELHDGIIELYDGVNELDDGTGQLDKGSTEFLNGMKTLNNSSRELIAGSQMIKDALSEINDALDVDMDFDVPDASELKELPKVIRGISKELKQFSEVLEEISNLLTDLPAEGLNENDFAKVYAVLDDYEADEDVYEVVHHLVGTYIGVEALLYLNENLPSDLDEVAKEIGQYLDEIANELENNLHLLDDIGQINELIDGLQTIAREYNQFHQGLVAYANGLDELTSAYREIDSGINELSGGTTTLKDGVQDLVDGTKELHEATSDLPDEMQSEIDQFMADFDFSDFKPKSFISKKNKKIGVVQFVLQTETIELPKADDDVEVQEETKGFWQKFLDLFR